MKATPEFYYKTKQEIDQIRKEAFKFFENRDDLYAHLSKLEEILDNEILIENEDE